ncbi:MAG: hypothetical protein HGB12_06500 [Bacteroidetes bacterium]|nr:hypothetical protein [Bacteroidota bacterium]
MGSFGVRRPRNTVKPVIIVKSAKKAAKTVVEPLKIAEIINQPTENIVVKTVDETTKKPAAKKATIPEETVKKPAAKKTVKEVEETAKKPASKKTVKDVEETTKKPAAKKSKKDTKESAE